MKPMPQEPVPSESDSLDLDDAYRSFRKELNVVISVLIVILVPALIAALVIIYNQIEIGRRMTSLEDGAGISQEQDTGTSVDDTNARLDKVDSQLQSVDDQLVALDDQVQKNVDITNENNGRSAKKVMPVNFCKMA